MKNSYSPIDIGKTSVYAGSTWQGMPVMVRIDKLSFVSHSSNYEHRQKLGQKLDRMRDDSSYGVNWIRGGTCHYKQAFTIRDSANREAYLLIEFEPRRPSIGCVRFELSPQHFDPDEISQLFEWLSHPDRLGKVIYKVLSSSWVTRLDFAVDLYGCRLSDLIIGLQGARSAVTFDNDDDLDGLRLGSVRSKLYAVCYDKFDGSNQCNEAEPVRKTFDMDLLVQKLPRFTRVEVRSRPGKGFLLSRLSMLDNAALKKLSFYDPSLVDDQDLPDDFSRALRMHSLPIAMLAISGSRADKERQKRVVKRVLKRYEIQAFDPDEVWDGWLECVDNLGILGQPAYWIEKHRLRRKAVA